jgi:3-polyprenyl-4-hydroxybenzoate decarboxylase
MNGMKRYVFAMTGASGQAVGLRALKELAKRADEVHVLVSTPAFEILRDEAGVDWLGAREEGEAARLGESPEETVTGRIRKDLGADNVHYWGERNFHSPVSSGSFKTDGMLIVPCTMKTLAGVACGYAETLVERAADVTLKEGRRLLVAPREMQTCSSSPGWALWWPLRLRPSIAGPGAWRTWWTFWPERYLTPWESKTTSTPGGRGGQRRNRGSAPYPVHFLACPRKRTKRRAPEKISGTLRSVGLR